MLSRGAVCSEPWCDGYILGCPSVPCDSLLLGAGKRRFLNTCAPFFVRVILLDFVTVCGLYFSEVCLGLQVALQSVCWAGVCVCVQGWLWADTGKNSNKTATKPKE